MPAEGVEAELASVSDADAQARAFRIVATGAAEQQQEGGGKRGSSGAKSPSSHLPFLAEEVGPVRDAVACRIALRDC